MTIGAALSPFIFHFAFPPGCNISHQSSSAVSNVAIIQGEENSSPIGASTGLTLSINDNLQLMNVYQGFEVVPNLIFLFLGRSDNGLLTNRCGFLAHTLSISHQNK